MLIYKSDNRVTPTRLTKPPGALTGKLRRVTRRGRGLAVSISTSCSGGVFILGLRQNICGRGEFLCAVALTTHVNGRQGYLSLAPGDGSSVRLSVRSSWSPSLSLSLSLGRGAPCDVPGTVVMVTWCSAPGRFCGRSASSCSPTPWWLPR